MKKTIRSFFTAALSLATLLITGSSWAAATAPVAVWDGFSGDNLTRKAGNNVLKLDLNGNEVNADGSVTVGNNNGISFLIYDSTGTTVQKWQGLSVMALVSNCPAIDYPSLIALHCQNDTASLRNIVGLSALSDGKVRELWGGSTYVANSGGTSSSVAGDVPSGDSMVTIGVSWKRSGTAANRLLISNGHNYTTGLSSSKAVCDLDGAYIGGYELDKGHYGNVNTWTRLGDSVIATGMKIHAIAVFNDEITSATATAFSMNKWIGGGDNNWSTAANWSKGTVPASGDAAIIPESAVVDVDASATPTGVSVQGSGTIIVHHSGNFNDANVPSDIKLPSGLNQSTWTGTLWIKATDMSTTSNSGWNLSNYGNAASTVRFSGVHGYLAPTPSTFNGTLDLDNDGGSFAFRMYSGSSSSYANVAKLTGTGKIDCTGSVTMGYGFGDVSGFTGSINSGTFSPHLGETLSGADKLGRIVVPADANVKVASGSTWTSGNGGIVINGTIGGEGTLGSATTFGAGATMDLSGRALDASAFVNNALTISETTKFVFPATLAPDTAYPLCTGALTATPGHYEVTVGEKTALATLTFGEADGAKTVAYQWHAAKNTAEISDDIAWADIDWDGGDFIANADIELTLKKDASITFNEAVIFAKPIRILGGFTATFVCDGAIPTFVMDEEWNEIIYLKNLNFNNWDFSAYTHNGTPIKFTGVTGFGPKNTTGELTVEAILIDEGALKAITVTDGYSDNAAFTFDKISGSGTFTFSKDTDKPPTPTYIFKDVSEFTGKFENTEGLKIVLGNGSGTGYTASAITYLADSKVKAGLGWSAPMAVFTDWMKVIGSVDDTLVTLESEPTALAMVTLLDESGAEKEGLFRLVYESGAVKIAEASEIVVDVANKKDMGAWTIEDPTELAGAGGVQASSLTLTAEAKLILDPTKTPVKLGAAPTFAEGAKLALSAAYKDCALGKFTLLTWTGAAIETEGIFDTASVGGACALACVDAPESGKKQLVLTVGDYANAKKIKVMPLGDSITEGTNQYQDFARPNYRIPLMQKLAANGFNVEALGYQKSCNADSAGVQANPEYEWHCGMSGQMCRTQGAAGWEDSIDVALDMAGEPDIVTFKIGTNDLRGGVRDPEVLFEAWTNVIWKILKARPATRVICGSVIDARDDQTYNTTKVVEFNAKIADFIANGDFPGGRVYFADLNAACPPRDANGNDNGNLADALHPSWIGHDKMSDCWLAKIKEVMAIPFTPEKPVTYTTTTAIEDNIPQEYRNGFVKLATYTPTAAKKHTSGTALTAADYDYYATDRAEEVFTKVGYYVVLKRQDTALVDYHDHVRFLWVDMAAFGDGTLADFGVPTVKKNQQIVDALHVYSNDTGIRKVEPTDNSAKGFVEFWPFSYGTTASDVEGAPAKLYGYDWNDLCSDSGVYGSMQVHRIFEQGESWNAGEVLFAYNRWTSNNNNEIGIGSFAQKMSSTTIDYTMTAGLEKVNAAAYEVMSIEIWGMPVAIEPTASVAEDEAEGYEAVVKFTADDIGAGYNDWNAKFILIPNVAIGDDEIKLGGSYAAYEEGKWIDLEFPACAANAEIDVLGLGNIENITVNDVFNTIQTFKCGVKNLGLKNDAAFTLKLVITDGATTKEICSINNLKVEAKAIEPVDPEEPKSYDTEKEAQDAAAKMNGEDGTIKPEYINAPAGFEGDKAAYAALFTAVPEGNTVTVKLTTDAQAEIAAELKDANEATILTPDAEGKATITAKPGLYYGIVAEGSLDAMATGKGQNWTLATGDTVKVSVPEVKDVEGSKAKAAFFRPTCAVKAPAAE